MVYTLLYFFSSKCSLFHNSNIFGSCNIHILCTGCAKIKKNNSGAERLTAVHPSPKPNLLHVIFLQLNLCCPQYRLTS